MSTEQGPEPSAANERPLLRVVRGNPTPEEIAALVVAVSATAARGGESKPPRKPSQWAAHHRKLRQSHRPGPGAWQASALPR